jgi:predicted phage terminase large subunit-like protein
VTLTGKRTEKGFLKLSIDLEHIRDACKTSLHFLCTQVLGYKEWDHVHDDLERFLNRPSRRKLVLVPRGHLKTSLVTKAYTIQLLLRNPDLRILICNQVWDKAREMLYEIKQFLTDKSDLPKLFGNFVSERWREDDIVLSHRRKALAAPSIGTSGVEAELTSSHYDVIFCDDLQGEKNYQTPEAREKVKRYYRSMIDLLEPGGQLIVIGTRWHLDDVYQYILDNEAEYYDVTVRRIVEDGQIIFPKKFAKRIDALTKTWQPAEATCMDFINYLKRRPSEEFASQYMNNPIDSENQIFKSSYFKYWSTRPPRLHVSMTIDPAISEKQNADYFVIDVSGMDENHNIYRLDYAKGRWKVSEQIDQIFAMVSKWHPSAVGLETVAYQLALKSYLEEAMRMRKVYFPITELKRNTTEKKEYRIKSLEPFFRDGKYFLAPWMKSFEEEALSFPKGRHDDELDAAASQLELLLPGDGVLSEGFPAGCWEEAASAARRANQGFQDFFHERLESDRRPETKSFWDRVNP